jgi:hypothetical protein
MFAKLTDFSLLRTLDLDLLQAISIDLTAEILILIGKPELPNNQWTVEERVAACHFRAGRISEVLEVAAANLEANWNFEKWPRVPNLVDWVDGSRMMQFVAGSCSEFEVNCPAPPCFARLVDGIKLAKAGEFKAAVDLLEDSIYVYDFLRFFANEPSLWAKVVEQIEDEDIRRCGFHFLISASPKPAYVRAVQELPPSQSMVYVASQLARADGDLINIVSVRRLPH